MHELQTIIILLFSNTHQPLAHMPYVDCTMSKQVLWGLLCPQCACWWSVNDTYKGLSPQCACWWSVNDTYKGLSPQCACWWSVNDTYKSSACLLSVDSLSVIQAGAKQPQGGVNMDAGVELERFECLSWISKQQGKSEGFDSCDRPINLTQIGFKSSIFQPVWPWNLMDHLKKQ